MFLYSSKTYSYLTGERVECPQQTLGSVGNSWFHHLIELEFAKSQRCRVDPLGSIWVHPNITSAIPSSPQPQAWSQRVPDDRIRRTRRRIPTDNQRNPTYRDYEEGQVQEEEVTGFPIYPNGGASSEQCKRQRYEGICAATTSVLSFSHNHWGNPLCILRVSEELAKAGEREKERGGQWKGRRQYMYIRSAPLGR